MSGIVPRAFSRVNSNYGYFSNQACGLLPSPPCSMHNRQGDKADLIYRSAAIRLHDCFLLDSCNAISPQHGEARQICRPHSPRAAVRLL